MKYRHQFRVSASVERVAEFHADSASMAAITPPPIVVKVQPQLGCVIGQDYPAPMVDHTAARQRALAA
jgi:ligand-binding SRPBCC domain-containing protein